MNLASDGRSPLLAAYAEMLSVVERQREALAPFDPEAWEALARERDDVFVSIQENEQSGKYLNSDAQAELRRLIAKVLEHDQVLETALLQALANLRAELGELQLGSVALNSYSVENSLDAYFIDQNS